MDRSDKIVISACLLAASFLLGTEQCKAADLHFQVHGISYHTGARDTQDWNERNVGAGLRLQFNPDWALQGGFYDNSYRKTTGYLIANYTPLHYGRASFGVFGGYASGYESVTTVPAIAGLMAILRVAPRTSVNLRYVPKIGDALSGVFAIEVGFQL